MIEYQESIDIQCPAADVFAYLIEAKNIPQWVDTTIKAWQVSDGPVGEGTLLAEIVTQGFSKSQTGTQLNWEITEFEVNRRVTFAANSSWGYQRQSFILDPTNQGTRLVVNALHRLQGPFRLLQPVLGIFVKKARREQLLNLKQILETGQLER
jgi:hypothetical protein